MQEDMLRWNETTSSGARIVAILDDPEQEFLRYRGHNIRVGLFLRLVPSAVLEDCGTLSIGKWEERFKLRDYLRLETTNYGDAYLGCQPPRVETEWVEK